MAESVGFSLFCDSSCISWDPLHFALWRLLSIWRLTAVHYCSNRVSGNGQTIRLDSPEYSQQWACNMCSVRFGSYAISVDHIIPQSPGYLLLDQSTTIKSLFLPPALLFPILSLAYHSLHVLCSSHALCLWTESDFMSLQALWRRSVCAVLFMWASGSHLQHSHWFSVHVSRSYVVRIVMQSPRPPPFPPSISLLLTGIPSVLLGNEEPVWPLFSQFNQCVSLALTCAPLEQGKCGCIETE